MNEAWSERVGNVITLNKSISDADIALFGLISRDDDFVALDPAPPVRQPRQVAPYPWLGALLATAAAHLISPSAQAGFLEQRIEFSEPAYADDTLHLTVELVEYDRAKQAIRVSVTCRNQDHRHLAAGDFSLDVGEHSEPM